MPEQLTERALDAFWQVVADEYPAAHTGDVSSHPTVALKEAARRVIEE